MSSMQRTGLIAASVILVGLWMIGMTPAIARLKPVAGFDPLMVMAIAVGLVWFFGLRWYLRRR